MASRSIRTREAASSIRSMALSGSRRSDRYRVDRSTAASRASSVMRSRWWASYRSRTPRRMARAVSRSGSFTVTGWKRRSRAASFSIYRRYSSVVVAPTTWSSPRPRAGLMMLAASMAPSAEPAPTMVCSSSMNRMMPPTRRTSASTFFTRSSNSPRYLVPATMAVRSRATSRLPRRSSGTSPATIRRASPSATAVLPTPGSPMRAGLFFCRRERIWITRRISSSRPTTGSSSPLAAIRVRSRENWSSSLVSPPEVNSRSARARPLPRKGGADSPPMAATTSA